MRLFDIGHRTGQFSEIRPDTGPDLMPDPPLNLRIGYFP